MKNFQLEQFSGPLDLLLSLIDEEKLDISEVSLSAVTEQYLNYLNQIENRKPEELADFLLIAARLLLLKSKKLLPQMDIEEEGGSSLEEQLRLYKVFIEASRKIHQAWQENKRAVFRIEPPRKRKEFIPPENLALESMRESMVKLLQRIQPLKPLPQTHIDKTVSLEEKINQIRALLSGGGAVNFSAVLQDSQSRTEVIIGFLALLELVKQKAVFLKQKQSFNDIVIEKT